MPKIRRWRHKSPLLHLLGWIQGVADIVDGCVVVLSLGFYSSTFELSVATWRTRAMINAARRRAHLTTHQGISWTPFD